MSNAESLEDIQKQITWLPFRNAANPPAVLYTAIKEKWAKPENVPMQEHGTSLSERYNKHQAQSSAQEAKRAERRRKHALRRQQLLNSWNPLSVHKREQLRNDAITKAPSNEDRKQFQACDLSKPPTKLLEVISNHLAVGVGE